MFSTHALADAVILVTHGHTVTTIETPADDLCCFVFERLDEARAREVLASAEADIMRRFHRTWRTVRRRMQAATEAAKVGQ
jgi:hypothetical protein